MQLPDTNEFTYKDCIIGGDECWLITPQHIGCKWNDDNVRFRSCIVRKSDNFVVSQGFGKFIDFLEDPDFQPWDKSWPIDAIAKVDGSLLIVSRYKGELIIRTRGTTDARQLSNGFEIDLLMEKYLKAFDNKWICENNELYTFLYEWSTPNNVICLREHSEPTLTLIGIVENRSCSYTSQTALDEVAKTIGVGRPKRYHFNSIEECIEDVEAWKGKEGVVLYSPDGQTLKRIKSEEYKYLHRIYTGLRSIGNVIGNVIDLFLTSPKFTKYSEFYEYVEVTISNDMAEKLKDDILKITVAYSKIVEQLERVKNMVDQMRGRTRKEQALDICQLWQDWRKSAAFLALDNRPIDDKIIRKALEETII